MRIIIFQVKVHAEMTQNCAVLQTFFFNLIKNVFWIITCIKSKLGDQVGPAVGVIWVTAMDVLNFNLMKYNHCIPTKT